MQLREGSQTLFGFPLRIKFTKKRQGVNQLSRHKLLLRQSYSTVKLTPCHFFLLIKFRCNGRLFLTLF